MDAGSSPAVSTKFKIMKKFWIKKRKFVLIGCDKNEYILRVDNIDSVHKVDGIIRFNMKDGKEYVFTYDKDSPTLEYLKDLLNQ